MDPNSGNSYDLIDMAPFPHCDSRLLHEPKACQYCDQYPERQKQRIADGVNFSGKSDPNLKPCPSEAFRPIEVAHKWAGNRPVPFETDEMDDS